MNKEDFVHKLKEVLSTYPGYKLHSTEISIHCPSCERTRPAHKEGHFSISLVKPNHPAQCWKCSFRTGSFNIKFLEKLGIEDYDIKNYVSKNIKYVKSNLVNINERDKKLDYKINTKPVRKYEFDKLQYLSHRSGVDFLSDLSKLDTYRVITSVKTFFKDNGIDENDEKLKFNQTELQLLETDYIGFLSYFGNQIQFRNIRQSENHQLSHRRLMINKEVRRSFLYVPRVQFDPVTRNPRIIVSEGPIDIIVIHNNNSEYDTDTIYGASGSKGSLSRSLKSILNLSGYYGAEINLYLDNDDKVKTMDEFNYSQIIDDMTDYFDSFKISVRLNLNGKDFSKPGEEIVMGVANLNKLYNIKRRMENGENRTEF
jgi:hypothetical protein